MIYESHYPAVESWSQKGAFQFLFEDNPRIDLEATALIDAQSGATTTFRSLISSSRQFADGFSRTLPPSHPARTILIYAPNSLLYPVLLFGALAAGITLTTANNNYTASELVHQLKNSGAALVIVGEDGVAVAKAAAREVGIGEEMIYVIGGAKEGLNSVEELRGSEEFKAVEIREEERGTKVAYLPYSSGTTGLAKGVLISHANLTAISQQVANVPIFAKKAIVMGVLPLYHMYGMIILLQHTIYLGGTVVLMPKFDLPKYCEAIQTYRATTALIVPPIALGLAKSPVVSEYDLSSLKYILCGAAPLSAELQAVLEDRFEGKITVVQGYGMSETSAVALLPDLERAKVGSCGHILPGMNARLVNSEGKDVRAGESGELWIRGPNIMLGYHANEKATRETIVEGGWLTTGDVCIRSEDGHYTIVDRVKELIKVKGFQVPPAELEAVLLTCPYVADCAVIGVWVEEQATELPRAYVVPDAQYAQDKDVARKIEEFVAGKVARHKWLRAGVFLVDSIPKSPSGKILRKDLRAQAAKEGVIYTSPFPEVQTWANTGIFHYLLLNNKKIDVNKAAIIDSSTGVATSYGQLIEESLRFGHGLTNVAGLEKGDTLLLFSPNSVLYPILLFAGQAAGVTVSTANAGYTAPELAHQLQDSSAKVVLVSSDVVDVARAAAKEIGFPEDRIYVLPGSDGKVVTGGLKSYELLRGEDGFAPVEFNQEELTTSVAFLPYSSGTTSRPKGVQISHSNITSTSQQLNEVKGLFDQPEIVLGCLPLSHIFGLVVLLHQTLANGGTIILMPKFDLVEFCAAVQRYKATVALIVPPMALGLAKHPIVDKYDLTSLRFFMCGAAPLSAALQSALETRLKGPKVLQGFGMTETTSVALLPDIDDGVPGTCGKLFPSMEARLVDEDGKDVALGEAGELWIRGKNIMLQYHKNEKATKETIHEDGWLKTGDVCVRSESGHYTIVERVKELIKYSGFQVPPAELEAVLLTCPYVADCAVIGVWAEERATELPRAYVVIEAAYADDKEIENKIAEFVASKVASHKRLRGGVHRIDVVPKSPSGKILRKDLRVKAAKEAEGQAKL